MSKMSVDEKKSGVYFNLYDESDRPPSDFLNGLDGLYNDSGNDSSGTSDSPSFRVRINVQGDLLVLGSAPLPNFILDEETGLLDYSDDEDGSPSIDQIELNSNGVLLLEDGD